jgi:hypothetical protein
MDPIEQLLLVVGLLQEIDGTCTHGLDRQRHIAVPGDEDHRQDRADLVEPLLQLDAAHARHTDVEHQAARVFRLVGEQELRRGWIAPTAKPH